MKEYHHMSLFCGACGTTDHPFPRLIVATYKWSPRQLVAAATPWGPHVNPAVHRMTQNLAGGNGIAQKQRAFRHIFLWVLQDGPLQTF